MKRIIQISFLVAIILPFFSCEREIPVTSIVMNQEKADLFVDESLQLYVSITPSDATDRTTLWGTSTPSVASVTQDGLVHALSEGVSTITATVGKRSTNCIVTVRRKEIPVSSIALNKQRITLNRNASDTLIATVFPNDATNQSVQWLTENETIATVDQNGVVLGVGNGMTAITARIENASTSCIVTVVVPIESLTLNKTSIMLKPKGEYQLKVDIYPTDASDVSLSWDSDNTVVATVDNMGKVTAKKPGKAIITVRSGVLSSACEVYVLDNSDKLPEFIDLGLSVKWATFNLGASEIWETGAPYAWGETEIKNFYDWSTYNYSNGSDHSLTKYCTNSYYGHNKFQDGKTTLENEDDAVFHAFGDSYRMPSDSEWGELLSSCNWEFIRLNGVPGYKITSNVEDYKDQWIFLPFGKIIFGMRTEMESEQGGSYWSSSLYEIPYSAKALEFGESQVYWNWLDRCFGCMIRPVKEK